MTQPLVSVIVPAFQAQATINRCIQSLRATALAPGDWEILIESDDGTAYDWVAQGQPQIKAAQGQAIRTGPGPTRNRALLRAKGEWITYVDADDHVEPGYLDTLLTTARRSGAALAQTRIAQGDRCVMQFGTSGGALTFADWGRSGISVRGLFPAQHFLPFQDAPAQDILHIVEILLMQPLIFCDAVYVLTLGPDTVTAQPGFADQVKIAYARHIDYLRHHHPAAPRLACAIAFWQAKAALNRSYQDHAGGLSYYAYVARNA